VKAGTRKNRKVVQESAATAAAYAAAVEHSMAASLGEDSALIHKPAKHGLTGLRELTGAVAVAQDMTMNGASPGAVRDRGGGRAGAGAQRRVSTPSAAAMGVVVWDVPAMLIHNQTCSRCGQTGSFACSSHVTCGGSFDLHCAEHSWRRLWLLTVLYAAGPLLSPALHPPSHSCLAACGGCQGCLSGRPVAPCTALGPARGWVAACMAPRPLARVWTWWMCARRSWRQEVRRC
jgi:hypothetical protein